MKTFKDTEGREWIVAVNVAAIKRVKDLLGDDLLALVDDGFKPLGELLADAVRLVDVIYVLCKPKADERGITDEQFGQAMAGDAIFAAADAFLEEYIDFFPDPRRRAGLKLVLAKAKAVESRMMDLMAAKLDQIDPDSEATRLIASSGSSPGSSGSTPANSLSENSP